MVHQRRAFQGLWLFFYDHLLWCRQVLYILYISLSLNELFQSGSQVEFKLMRHFFLLVDLLLCEWTASLAARTLSRSDLLPSLITPRFLSFILLLSVQKEHLLGLKLGGLLPSSLFSFLHRFSISLLLQKYHPFHYNFDNFLMLEHTFLGQPEPFWQQPLDLYTKHIF